MPLAPGTRIGVYEVMGAIGAGGMGEVYQARDTKLNRIVALKILPASLAGDPDRLARFKREAQVLASLNHPNIAIIHGFEDSGDTHALIMELVPGRTVAELAAKPIPVTDALPIARQIASALEAAHDQGVVHRDLKPANIKVTDDGTVKVLDFGLAKLSGPEGASNPAASGATTSTSPALTEMGIILGTAGYMSPEQAKGKPVDRRADIWAFGVVVFEMLSGKFLYRGDSVTETIANLITQPPDWNALPAATPAPVRRLLRKCLEKDARSRYQSAGDVRIEIEEMLSGVSSSDSGPLALPAPTAPSPGRRLLPWAIAALLLVALVYTQRPKPVASDRQMRFEMRLDGEDLFIDENTDSPIAVLTPDGGTLVYVGTFGPVRRLYSRPLNQLESKAIPGTEGAQHQFFSPDGQSLAFFANGNLKTMPVAGGAATTLVGPTVDGRGGTWGPDGTIVFSATATAGLSRVAATGGTPSELTKLGPNERTHRWPWFLPGGKSVLFMCQLNDATYDEGTIEAVRLDTGQRKVLVPRGTFPRYAESGHLVFSRANTVYAVAFDPDKVEVHGEPRPVLTGVFSTGRGLGGGLGNGSTQLAIASNGTAVYVPSQTTVVDSALKLAIVDRNGMSVYEHPDLRAFRDPTFSIDGRRVFVRVGDGKSEHIHVLDLSRGTLTQIIFDGGFSGIPVMAPDNVRMAFAGARGGKPVNGYLVRNDGTGAVTPIAPDGPQRFPTSFSPHDGQYLAVSEVNPKTGMDLMVVSLADGNVKEFLASPANEMGGVFSPDGRWMAYQSAEGSPAFDVFVRSYPDGGALRQVSAGGGFGARWTKGGSELVYGAPAEGGMAMMAVDVTAEGPALAFDKPVRIFKRPVAFLSTGNSFDVTADGRLFAVILRSSEQVIAPKRMHVTVVTNFFDDIRRAMAAK